MEFLVPKRRQCGSMCAYSFRYHCICLHIPSRKIAIHEKERQMRLVFITMRYIYDDIQQWTRYHSDICLPSRLFDSFDHNYNVSLTINKEKAFKRKTKFQYTCCMSYYNVQNVELKWSYAKIDGQIPRRNMKPNEIGYV